jgi:hypothetical protein
VPDDSKDASDKPMHKIVCKEKSGIIMGRQTTSRNVKVNFNYPNLLSQVEQGRVKDLSLKYQKVESVNKAPNADVTSWKQEHAPPCQAMASGKKSWGQKWLLRAMMNYYVNTYILSKIASCALSALMQEIQPCALDEGNHGSPKSPPVSAVVNTRDCLKFRELKYKVVTATKVVGKHSHPNFGWEGSLTTQTNEIY